MTLTSYDACRDADSGGAGESQKAHRTLIFPSSSDRAGHARYAASRPAPRRWRPGVACSRPGDPWWSAVDAQIRGRLSRDEADARGQNLCYCNSQFCTFHRNLPVVLSTVGTMPFTEDAYA